MNSPAPVILMIEDEPHIRRFVRTALENEHCQVIECDTIKQGLLDAGARTPDLVILDLGLPDGNGLQFVQDIRSWSLVPILVLSARSTEPDKIGVLDAGADDYLTKPFSIGELLARVRALLRRNRQFHEHIDPVVQCGTFTLDMSKRIVMRNGNTVHLTPLEYRLLCVLVANAGKVMTHHRLLHDVWGPAYSDSAHYLRIYVGHLRQKLEDDPAQPQHFLTETGIGYRFQY